MNQKWCYSKFMTAHQVRYHRNMATFSVRLDSKAEAQLRTLIPEGGSRNAAIRHAIDIAYHQQLLITMEQESRELLDDGEDRAELAAARVAIGAGDAW